MGGLKKKFSINLLIVLLIGFLSVSLAEADLSIGVNRGDWIEYAVTTSGSPPEQFNLTWARMLISHVEGASIEINVTTRSANGTMSSRMMILNLQKGEIGAWFIIPANLNVGDSFLDSDGQYVMIQGEQQLEWAGDLRTLTNATTPQRIKHWDKLTGVFVQCIDVFDNYTINATATNTNMWKDQDNNFFVTNVEVLVIFLSTGMTLLAVEIVKWKINKAQIFRSYFL